MRYLVDAVLHISHSVKQVLKLILTSRKYPKKWINPYSMKVENESVEHFPQRKHSNKMLVTVREKFFKML